MLIKSQGSQISWSSIAHDTEISSHNTVQDYVRTLENLFVTSIINVYNKDTKKAIVKRHKKIYFQDPFLFHMYYNQSSNNPSFDQSLGYLEDEGNKGRILEGVISNHLIRWVLCQVTKNRVLILMITYFIGMIITTKRLISFTMMETQSRYQ